jgi:hypothetical protein
MRHWTFWEWVAYIGLSIAAIIIAADQGVKLAPELLQRFSGMITSPFWAFAPLALIILATVILIGREIGWIGPKLEDIAELHLRYYQGHPIPTAVSYKNIWRWFSLQNNLYVHTPLGLMTGSNTNIFIAFEKPVKVGTLILSSADYVMPKYEVKEFNNRFAVITIDETPAGVLDIKAGIM